MTSVMRSTLMRLALVLLCAGGTPCPTASADPPWARLLSTSRPEADPDAEYRLSESNGPWLIMAASFAGEGAEHQARALALELRKRYKLHAYVHSEDFTLEENAPGRGVDPYGNPLKFRYQREGGAQYAVLVGDFPDADDAAAQKTLGKIKSMTPDSVKIAKDKTTNLQLANWREICRWQFADKKRGPMGSAFMTANPLLPDDYFAPRQGIDPDVAAWNAEVEHSLLKCPGKYTVQVATFRGTAEIRPDKVRLIERGEMEFKSKLEKAAIMAHKLTVALRAKGYEAYEFHDRQASIVTVGGFNSVGTPRADGKIEINPRILEIMQRFGSQRTRFETDSSNMPITYTKTVIGIPLDMQPIPVEVPRVSVSQAYDRPAREVR